MSSYFRITSLAPLARGTLQIHWPEGNVLVRRGVTDPAGGVPDYNATVSVERVPHGSKTEAPSLAASSTS